MADLAKFNELFTALETAVIQLDKREHEASQSCKTLEARLTFLKQEIKRVEELKKAEVAKRQTVLDELAAQKITLNEEIAETEKKQRLIVADYDKKNNSLEAEVNELTKQLETLGQDIKQRRLAIENLKSERATLQAEIDELKAQIVDLKEEQTSLADTVAVERKVTDESLESYKLELDRERQELAAIRKAITSASDELVDSNEAIKVAHDKLVAIRRDSQKLQKADDERSKALDAREESINEQAHDLEVRLITSRRRNNTLGNPA